MTAGVCQWVGGRGNRVARVRQSAKGPDRLAAPIGKSAQSTSKMVDRQRLGSRWLQVSSD
jgi:hypothetical protein